MQFFLRFQLQAEFCRWYKLDTVLSEDCRVVVVTLLLYMFIIKKTECCLNLTSTSGTWWFSSYGSINREPMAKPMKTSAPTERKGDDNQIWVSLRNSSVTQKSDHPHWNFLCNESATDNCESSTDDVSEDSSKTDTSHVIDTSHHYGGQLGPGEWESERGNISILR